MLIYMMEGPNGVDRDLDHRRSIVKGHQASLGQGGGGEMRMTSHWPIGLH